MLFRSDDRDLRAARQRAADAGFTLKPVEVELDPDTSRKQQAIECYRSQLTALGERARTAVRGPEVYYQLLDQRR